jgi:hypothetical protein
VNEAAKSATPDRGKATPRRRGRQGGAGGAGGVNFQARIAAWAAAMILAERDAVPPWGWRPAAQMESVHAETGEPADDLLVANSEGARAWLQAKLTLDLSSLATSEFAKTISQFAAQFLQPRKDGVSIGAEDRLVLAVGPEASGKVRKDLPRVLKRLVGAAPGQSLDGAAGSDDERAALAAFLTHTRAAWKTETGTDPSDSELRDLASHIRVTVLDLSGEGEARRRAQEYLRASVLQAPTEAGAAFSLLEGAGAVFAETRTGADRARLQRLLTGEGIGLKAAPSYRDDVAALERHSRLSAAMIEPLSRIAPAGATPIHLERRALIPLEEALTGGSLLLTGEPGIGKSGLLFELVNRARGEDRPVLVLAAEALLVESGASLQQELGLEHDVVDVLRHWPSAKEPLLVIDGLDAARGEKSQSLLLNLIAETAPAWRVLASVRRFDLRYHQKLRDLFTVLAAPPVAAEWTAVEFADVHHFFLGELGEFEFTQLAVAAPGLAAALESAPEALRDLARVPFNLRLLAELIGIEGIGEFEPITTQLQLLDAYWRRRVIGQGAAGRARVIALRRVVDSMLETRGLQVARRRVEDEASSSALTGLLGDGVLAEQETGAGMIEEEVLGFSHNVLFDHAVERLRFRGGEDALAVQLAADPDLLLLARPSLEMHLRHIWESGPDRMPFWKLAGDLVREDGVVSIGRVIAPTVAATLIRTAEDMEPLLAALRAGPDRVAEELLQHLVAAAAGEEPIPITATAAGRLAFAGLAGDLAGLGSREAIVAPLVGLVSALLAASDTLGERETAELGRAGRALLELALSFDHPQRALVRPAIAATVAAYNGEPQASAGLLRRLIDPARIGRSGYQEMPDLADEVENLVPKDPLLVRDIYVAVFAHLEDSKEATSILQSQIIGLTSNKSQDFDGARYQLGVAFPEFLEAAPVPAIEALIAVRLAYARRHDSGPGIDRDVAVDWGGGEVKILGDGSHFWDRNPSSHDQEVKMLGDFEKRLDDLAANGDPVLDEILDALRTREVPAAIWRRALAAAGRSPDRLAASLVPLVSAPDALAERDLSDAIACFLPAGLPRLPDPVREEIESAILDLPQTYARRRPDLGDYAEEAASHTRDELLGGLRPDDLLTAAAKERAAGLGTSASFAGTSSEGVPDGDWGGAGSPAPTAPTSAFAERLGRLHEFADEHLNDTPSGAAVEAIGPVLGEVWEALDADSDDVTAELRDRGFEWVTRAAASLVRTPTKDLSPAILGLAREILLAGALNAEPQPDPERDADFDRSEGWSEAPRIQAAAGLMQPACTEEGTNESVLAEIDMLAADPVAAVRAQIAMRLSLLREHAPQQMWRIAEGFRDGEPSAAVRRALLRALPRMAPADVRRVAAFAEALHAAAAGEEGASALRGACVELLSEIHIWKDDAPAGAYLRKAVLAEPGVHREETRRVAIALRDPLVHGDDTPGQTALRARAIALCEFAVQGAAGEFACQMERVERKGTAGDETDEDFLRLRGAAELLDAVASEVYFASGVFQLRQGKPDPISPERRHRLYIEAGPLLDRLAEVPVAKVIHYLVQTLEGMVDFDPRGVFLRFARVIALGRETRYETETLAVNVFVRVVERYLAEYRTLIGSDAEMREALVTMLDTFVDAGWPQARRLTYGLHELFR